MFHFKVTCLNINFITEISRLSGFTQGNWLYEAEITDKDNLT